MATAPSQYSTTAAAAASEEGCAKTVTDVAEDIGIANAPDRASDVLRMIELTLGDNLNTDSFHDETTRHKHRPHIRGGSDHNHLKESTRKRPREKDDDTVSDGPGYHSIIYMAQLIVRVSTKELNSPSRALGKLRAEDANRPSAHYLSSPPMTKSSEVYHLWVAREYNRLHLQNPDYPANMTTPQTRQ
ncbi:hypothetical protein BGX38DRAFT_1270055 [Terfezia claveryi]|nr:hypothetical protein BGX38DRAFT_1270055 [Terfezia claveryi]